MNTVIDVSIITGAIALIKFLDHILTKKPIIKKLEKIDGNIGLMRDISCKTDEYGTPLVYMPRSFVDSQKEITSLCHETSKTLERVAYTLDILERKINAD
jgi:hypothetical protein